MRIDEAELVADELPRQAEHEEASGHGDDQGEQPTNGTEHRKTPVRDVFQYATTRVVVSGVVMDDRPATGWGSPYHRITALPHRNPEPNAVITRISPRLSFPALTHSSSAIGMVAAVVFPKRSMLL